MAKVRQHQCPRCGAPLEVSTGTSDIACKYCRTLVHVEWGKRPPATAPLPPDTIYARTSTLSFSPVFVWVLFFGGVLAALIVYFGMFDGSVPRARATPPVTTFPAVCTRKRELVIVGQQFSGRGALITAEDDCRLKIKDSTLKGDIVVLGNKRVEVTLENSTLEGKEAAVKLGEHSRLFAGSGSVLKGERGAILGVFSEAKLDGTSIEGAVTGIQSEAPLKLTGNQSKIVGTDHGIRSSGPGLQIEASSLSISGGKAGIETADNLKVDLRAGHIQGRDFGVAMRGSGGDIKLSFSSDIRASAGVAVKSEGILTLDLTNAEIEGEIGVETGQGSKLVLGYRSRVHGKRAGIRAGESLELQMKQAKLESEGVALCGGKGAKLSMTAADISGGSDAFRFERRPERLERTLGQITGKQRFGVGCGAR